MTLMPSHPFISYSYSTKEIDAKTWMLLGEAMSKCQHLAGMPLKPQAAERMMSVYLARGIQATTAIEGNTLSDDEVQQIVDKGSAMVPESRAYLEREVQNVLAAIREIDAAVRSGKRIPITVERVKELNAKVLAGIPDKPEVVPGEFRQHGVTAGPYRAPHWSETPDQVASLVNWLEGFRRDLAPDASLEERFITAILSAILAHLYIAWIHPFGNGNGRTARLLEVQILSESGIVPIVATNVLSNFYNRTRNAYYLALDEAQKDPSNFVRYAVRGFVDELREQIREVQKQNLAIHWESYVHEVFRDQPSSDAASRQRELALALPDDRLVTPEQATELTPALARLYGRCGERTPARDMNNLVKLGLAHKVKYRQYMARRYIIEAFIPPVSSSPA